MAAISSSGPDRLFQVLDVHWRSPESGDVWYKSRLLKKSIWYLAVKALLHGRDLIQGPCVLMLLHKRVRPAEDHLEQIAVFNCRHLYHKSPDFDEH